MSGPGIGGIGIVGTGAVGPAIGRLLHLRGHRVVAVAGRDPGRTARAAAFIDPSVQSSTIAGLASLTHRVLVAVTDAGIPEVAASLAGAGFGGAALHTCGALGPDALSSLQRAGVACGVLHPLQTIPDAMHGVERLTGIGFALAGDAEAIAWGREVIAALEGFEIQVAPDRLPLYHSAAVLAGNGTIALMDAAARLMELAGVHRSVALAGLQPLARTALENVFRSGPEAALTGPVARADAATIGLHAQAMADASPDLRGLYQATGRSLVGIARRRGVPDARLEAVGRALDSFRAGEH